MSTPDYDIHLDRGRFDALWDSDMESGVPFEEDLDDIERAIEEELGPTRRRKKRRKAD